MILFEHLTEALLFYTMREQKYNLVFDEFERGIILRSLNELRNRLLLEHCSLSQMHCDATVSDTAVFEEGNFETKNSCKNSRDVSRVLAHISFAMDHVLGVLGMVLNTSSKQYFSSGKIGIVHKGYCTFFDNIHKIATFKN